MQLQAQLPSQKCSRIRRRGTSALGVLTLLAIVSVVILVSVPRLRSFALDENESDARFIVALLAHQLEQLPVDEHASAGFSIEQLSHAPSVKQALSDGEFLEDGQLLRRHGFLFRVLRVDAASGHPSSAGSVLAGSRAVLAVQAWPWRHGRTGSAALLATDDGLIYRHDNQQAAWNGPAHPRKGLESWQGWKLLP